MNVEIGICPMIGFGYNRIKNTVNKDGEEIYNKNMHVILLPFLFILIGNNHEVACGEEDGEERFGYV